MNHEFNLSAVIVFALIVAFTLALSFYLGAKAKSAKGFFAAGGEIPWYVNGVAFAGDYLSAASFLGICGLIAFYGYDGFLYSIGFLAGWVVALFVVAEPLKKLGKYTFADALDKKFNSRAVKLTAAISTLAVSTFYLIPQMVGAGALVTPLFGLPHWVGVVMVGAVVILIVVTAGMVSTTWVQFIKGTLLVVFSAVLTVCILWRGFEVSPQEVAEAPTVTESDGDRSLAEDDESGDDQESDEADIDGNEEESKVPPIARITKLPDGEESTGPLGPAEFFSVFHESEFVLWDQAAEEEPETTKGGELLLPGRRFKGLSENFLGRLNFVSLMLALFCGTASLPHILIRYYTVKDQASARKSTIVGIATISFFYILTLYIGLGAMTSVSLDISEMNMAAPLLAKSFGNLLFAIISAIAFTTVLGTVSGLIIASSGAVAHDLVKSVMRVEMNESNQVRVAKITAIVVGIVAIILGILFEKMNVGFLVGWAFSVAASANLPALIMLLFWKRTNAAGVATSVTVGMVSSLAWILLSGDTYDKVYGLDPADAIVPFSQPGIVTIPLGFITLVVVSLLTGKGNKDS